MAIAQLFIPKTIRVGYKKRDDTYSGKLAYVIYIDNKGVVRKEKSWNSWRDEEIASEDYDNKPQAGFVLNKNIKRYNWSHFGSNASYIRVYDPRGIEFEITPENLIGILMASSISKRALADEYVYAWSGDRLVLLPVQSEEYQQAVQYTGLQDGKVTAKQLTPGCSYTTKKGEEAIYIGRFDWWHWGFSDGRSQSREHIFYAPAEEVKRRYERPNDNPEYGVFYTKPDTKFLSKKNTEEPVINYAELIDKFKADIHSSPIVDFHEDEPKIDLNVKLGAYGRYEIARTTYYKPSADRITLYTVHPESDYDYATKTNTFKGFQICASSSFMKKTLNDPNRNGYNNWNERTKKIYSAEEMEEHLRTGGFKDISYVLESGAKVPLREQYTYRD